MSYNSTKLWKNFSESDTQFSEQRDSLVHEFKELRKKTARLTGEIAQDLPDYTVHDIEHLDALWSVADQIVGDELTFNPLETFVLGAAFLFHDAGMTMAAYPGGWSEISATTEWQRIVRKTANDKFVDETERKRCLLGLFLREQHASRAEQLPFVEWQTTEGTLSLIQDHNTRLKLGKFIGEVSASHWWSHDDLAQKLSRVIPAPTGYPRAWKLDLLKIACVLRAADAANVDSSRAPGFLWALRKGRISDYSNMHWLFQNRITLPELRHEALFYASTRDFDRSEAKEWWLAFDTLTMVDRELRRSDAVLARNSENRSRLAAKRVANVDTPNALTSQITVRDWSPIDTAFSIDDIPRLVEKLGGEQLYGKSTLAPVRELIQNGMDAVRLRRKVDQGFDTGSVRINADEFDGVYKLIIGDDGVGLSFDTIVHHLLAFGTSGWLNDPAIGEFTDLFPSRDSVSGQFGIGFFSVFMIADKIKVISRRFDSGPNDTVILEFENGLKQRPILYYAQRQQRLSVAGTTIEIELDASLFADLTSPKPREQTAVLERLQFTFPTSDVPLDVSYLGRKFSIDGQNWRVEPAVDFLKRISRGPRAEKFDELINWEATAKYLQPVFDESGEVVGRLAGIMIGRKDKKFWHRFLHGSIVYKGARIADEEFFGVLEGVPARASRDVGIPICTPDSLRDWLLGQAELVGNDDIGDANGLWLGQSLIRIGAESGRFPIARLCNDLVSYSELKEKLIALGEVRLTEQYFLDHILNVVEAKWVDPTLLCDNSSIGSHSPGLFRGAWKGDQMLPVELKPFEKQYFDECPSSIKLACSILEVHTDVVDQLTGWHSFPVGAVERHVVTDKHGEIHKVPVLHLTRGMTYDEFNALNAAEQEVERKC